MIDSILNTIKKMLGIPATDTAFDGDVLVHINSVIANLFQIGVGPDEPFLVVDQNTEWTSLTTEERLQSMAKSYIFFKVKLAFDPPGTSFAIDAMNRLADEVYWRLNELANPYVPPVVIPEEEAI